MEFSSLKITYVHLTLQFPWQPLFVLFMIYITHCIPITVLKVLKARMLLPTCPNMVPIWRIHLSEATWPEQVSFILHICSNFFPCAIFRTFRIGKAKYSGGRQPRSLLKTNKSSTIRWWFEACLKYTCKNMVLALYENVFGWRCWEDC